MLVWMEKQRKKWQAMVTGLAERGRDHTHLIPSNSTSVDIQKKPKDRNDCFTKKHIVSELSRTLDSERELTFQFSGCLNCGQFTLDYFLWCYSNCLPMVLRHYKPCTEKKGNKTEEFRRGTLGMAYLYTMLCRASPGKLSGWGLESSVVGSFT